VSRRTTTAAAGRRQRAVRERNCGTVNGAARIWRATAEVRRFSRDGEWLALGFDDRPRDVLVARLKARGLALHLLSGDAPGVRAAGRTHAIADWRAGTKPTGSACRGAARRPEGRMVGDA
jgi:cation transport ATPase